MPHWIPEDQYFDAINYKSGEEVASQILCSQEINKNLSKFSVLARCHGWEVVVTAGTQDKIVAAIAIKAGMGSQLQLQSAASCYTERGSGAASARFLSPLGVLQIVSVYVNPKEKVGDSTKLARWITDRVQESRDKVVVIGDLNTRQAPTVTAHLNDTELVEMVQSRTTYRKKGMASSLDKAYVSYKLEATLELHHNSSGSDHSQMYLHLPIQRKTWSPKMLHPQRAWKPQASTYAEIWSKAEAQGKEYPRTLRPTKVSRLRKAESKLVIERAVAVGLGDIRLKERLNRNIKDIRKKLSHYTQGPGAERHVACTRQVFVPPLGDKKQWTDFYKEKFSAKTEVPVEVYELDEKKIPPPFTVQQIECASGTLKKRARTKDFAVTHLEHFQEKEKKLICKEFTQWIKSGIPVEKNTGFLFPVRKPNKKGNDPRKGIYRPLCILGLELKLFHHTIYLRVRDETRNVLERDNFQLAGGWCKAGIQKIIMRAIAHLEAAKDNVVLIADILSAYDTVEHEELLDIVEEELGVEWRTVVASILKNQGFQIVLYDGLTDVIKLKRGLMQGSSLSVMLFLLYVSKKPPIKSESWGIVDDITTLTTIEKVQKDIDGIQAWTEKKKMSLATDKVEAVSHKAIEFTVNGVVKQSVKKARLLGACLHTDSQQTNGKFKRCELFDRKIEKVLRVAMRIRSIRYCSSRRRAQLFSIFGLATISLHCLSKCFRADDSKIRDARNSLFPARKTCMGISNFSECSFGYNLVTIPTYTMAHRARAVQAGGVKIKEWMKLEVTRGKGAPSWTLEQTPENKPHPEILKRLKTVLAEAIACGKKESENILIATDGGRYPETCQGTLGVAVQVGEREPVTVGAKINQLVASSTQAEMIAALFLGAAVQMLGKVGGKSKIATKLVTDSTALISIQGKVPEGPAEELLCNQLRARLPNFEWAKGHQNRTQEERLVHSADRAAYHAVEEIGILSIYEAFKTKTKYWSLVEPGRPKTTQIEEIGRFIKTTQRMKVEVDARKKILDPVKGVPEEFIQKPILKKWKKWHGAIDLIQGIARRLFAPYREDAQAKDHVCIVRGCDQKPSLTHILEVRDELHKKAMGPLENIIFPIGIPWRGKMALLKAVADGDLTALLQISARFFVFLDEENPGKIRSYVTPKPKNRSDSGKIERMPVSSLRSAKLGREIKEMTQHIKTLI
eukprot:gene19618-116_t